MAANLQSIDTFLKAVVPLLIDSAPDDLAALWKAATLATHKLQIAIDGFPQLSRSTVRLTQSRQFGGVQYGLRTIMKSTDLYQDLRSMSKLEQVLSKSWNFVGTGVAGEAANLDIIVPSSATISRSLFRIDLLLIHSHQQWWQAQRKQQNGCWIVLCSDASNICGKEWFITEHDILLKKDIDLLYDTKVSKTASQAIKRVVLTPACLGSGKAGVANKLKALLHQVRLDVGADDLVKLYFQSVLGFLSDLGTEHLLATAPHVDLKQSRQTSINQSAGLLQPFDGDIEMGTLVLGGPSQPLPVVH